MKIQEQATRNSGKLMPIMICMFFSYYFKCKAYTLKGIPKKVISKSRKCMVKQIFLGGAGLL